jgi:hypothetical protein
LKNAIDIRWLALYDAVAAVHASYGSLVAAITSEADNKQLSIKAQAVHKFITEFSFPAVIALLCDVLKIVTNLSKKFQSSNIDLSSVEPSVTIAISQIMAFHESPGTCLKEFLDGVDIQDTKHTYKGVVLTDAAEQAVSFLSLKKHYIDNVIEALKARLLNDSVPTLQCFGLIEPLTDCSEEHQARCIEIVARKFGFVVDTAALGLEMAAVRALKNGCYKCYSMQAFAKAILTRHCTDLPETSKLCEIAMCIPVSTAVCERGFSLQNWLKSKFRNCLGESNLQNLMKICRGPTMDNFPFKVAVKHWYAAKRRRQARLFNPSNSKVAD